MIYILRIETIMNENVQNVYILWIRNALLFGIRSQTNRVLCNKLVVNRCA